MKIKHWLWAFTYISVVYGFIVVNVRILEGCAKEYSCENCRDTPSDTIPTPPVIISNMIAHYDIYIADNKDVKVIYPQYTGKYHPDTYKIMNILAIYPNTSVSSTYKGEINLRDWLPLNEVYNKGDSFLFRMEVRHRFGDIWYTDSTYLFY